MAAKILLTAALVATALAAPVLEDRQNCGSTW
jgi:cellulose 1,4-beta-cellobiosidase